MLNREQKDKLIKIASRAVENFIKRGEISEFEISDPSFKQQRGSFVSIYNNGKLRGCIGQIVSSGQPLWQTVGNMAIAAATTDNRFEPIKPEELPDLNYEISVLSSPRKINDWRQVELGKHGVIIELNGRCGVFLPQVAEKIGWDKEEFLRRLCQEKAGLPPESYKSKDAELKVFTAEVFAKNDI